MRLTTPPPYAAAPARGDGGGHEPRRLPVVGNPVDPAQHARADPVDIGVVLALGAAVDGRAGLGELGIDALAVLGGEVARARRGGAKELVGLLGEALDLLVELALAGLRLEVPQGGPQLVRGVHGRFPSSFGPRRSDPHLSTGDDPTMVPHHGRSRPRGRSHLRHSQVPDSQRRDPVTARRRRTRRAPWRTTSTCRMPTVPSHRRAGWCVGSGGGGPSSPSRAPPPPTPPAWH